MIPLRLEMNAFGPYAGQQIIDFRDLQERKLFLIYGPTGAGKTTVLDAICYALYGDTSGDLRSGAHMRSEYASPQEKTYVRFSFAIGQKRYCIERNPEQEIAKKRGVGLKKETAKAALSELNEDDTVKNVVATKNVTADVIQLLGFKSDQFRQVVLLPQGDFRKLLLATSSERQQIMQTLFHTQRYAKLQALAKEKYDAIEAAYGQTKEDIQRQLQLVNAVTEEELQTAYTTETQRYTALQQQGKEANRIRDAYQQTVQDAQVLYSHFQSLAKSRKLLSELQTRQEAIEAQKAYIALLEQAKVLAEPCRHLDEIQEKGTTAGQQEQAAAQGLEKAQADVQRQQRQLQTLQEKEAAYQDKRKQVVALQGLIPKVEAYHTVCQQVGLATRQGTAKEQAWQAGVAALRSLKTRWEAAQAEGAAYPQVLRAYEQDKAKLTQLEERLAQERQLDALAGQIRQLQEQTARLKAQTAAAAATARADAIAYESVQALFVQGQAAILADGLDDGMPCPVCGATTHPKLAIRADHMPQKEDVEQCKQKAAASETKRQRLQEEWTVQAARLREQERQHQAGRQQYPLDGTLADWQKRRDGQVKRVQDGAQQVAAGQRAQQQVASLQAEVKALETKEQTLRAAKDEAALVIAKLTESKRQGEADIPAAYRRGQALQAAMQEISQDLTQYDGAVEKARQDLTAAATTAARYEEQVKSWHDQVTQLRTEYKQGVAALQDRVHAAGFSTVGACRKMQQDIPKLDGIKQAVEAYIQAVQQVQGQIAQEQAYVGTQEQPQMAVYQAQLTAHNEQCRAIAAAAAQAASAVQQLRQVQQKIAALHEQQAALTEQYKAVGSLYELISGKVTGINFERYVLGALLDEVLRAANYRLDEMSRHRYELQRSQAWYDKRVRQIGLDIEVFDNYTGYARPANTLSGGETFLASLSLALGLADVVQAYSGGIHLDTIFIDEGFGTLDGETLDFALKALLQLKQGGRLVGIISHVPELRERIDTRLAVRKTDRGSTAAFEFV